MELKQRKFAIGYLAIALITIFVFQFPLFGPRAANVSYSEFKALAKKGKVSNLTLDKETISGTLATDGLEALLPKEKLEELKRRVADAPRSSPRGSTIRGWWPSSRQANVKFAGRVENTWLSTLLSWVLPAVVFVGVWVLLMRRLGPQQGLHGDRQEQGQGLRRAQDRRDLRRRRGHRRGAGRADGDRRLPQEPRSLPPPRREDPEGVLIVGAPGTGKTLLAKAVAGEAGVPFFSLSGSDFVEMFVGVGAARVRDLFAQAQEKAPSIIFIDELDALGKARGISPIVGGHDEREQTLNQLLAEMDGFDTQKGVIILAATNRPEILDPALLRPGRFDRQVVLDRPDLKGGRRSSTCTSATSSWPRASISPWSRHGRPASSAPTSPISSTRPRSTPPAREGRGGWTDFDEAIDRVVGGSRAKIRVINPKEKEIVAYHEAGHALVAESREHADRVAKISMIPRGVAALGYTQQQPTEDRYLMTRAELLDRLDVLLGGRVAEEIVFGDVSTGAQDDLQRATDMARHMVTRYGMSEALGLATFEPPRQALFLNVPSMAQREYSEETARRIDAEIRTALRGGPRASPPDPDRRSETSSRRWPSC